MKLYPRKVSSSSRRCTVCAVWVHWSWGLLSTNSISHCWCCTHNFFTVITRTHFIVYRSSLFYTSILLCQVLISVLSCATWYAPIEKHKRKVKSINYSTLIKQRLRTQRLSVQDNLSLCKISVQSTTLCTQIPRYCHIQSTRDEYKIYKVILKRIDVHFSWNMIMIQIFPAYCAWLCHVHSSELLISHVTTALC